MEKIFEFLKEKFYYVIGIFAIFIILIIVLVSCSATGGTTSYEKAEAKMIEAAKEYYSSHKSMLPKKEDETISIGLKYLVENDYLKEIKDPENSGTICDGNVEVTKRGASYLYQAFLECGTNYKTEFLSDALKTSLKTDDNGNGLYEVNGEYIFKGDDVKNYVNFNDELWQVIKIDSQGDVKLIKVEATEESYTWDDRYNVSAEDTNGINDFNKSRIRTTLENYYKHNFNNIDGLKGKIVKKDFCVGNRKETDPIDESVECSTTQKMYVGLINTSEFYKASLDTTCTKFLQKQCANYNYLVRDYDSWTLNGSKENSDHVYLFYNRVEAVEANDEKRLYPVIYIDKKTISKSGNGSLTNPYIIK